MFSSRRGILASLAATALLAGVATSPEPVIQRRNQAELIEQQSGRGPNKRQRRRLNKRQQLKAFRSKVNREGFITRLANKMNFSSDDSGHRKAAINSMTNWQRNQWAKAGYSRDDVKHFAYLTK